MSGTALRILKRVARSGEISLAEAIQLGRSCRRSHLDQYPLSLLLEEDYLGMTVNHRPPQGAEKMREFSLATTLHMWTLPKNERGQIEYLGIVSSGSMDPSDHRVFLKAKGALYLDELRQRMRDRLWSFVLGFGAGVVGPIASGWLRGQLQLP